MRRPVSWASTRRRASTAGSEALPVSDKPIASTIDAKVEAFPMVMQVPALRDMPLSAAKKSRCDISPRARPSLNFQTSVPEPMSRPRNLPLSIGPEETTIVGRFTLAAPMSWPGVVLSQAAEQNDRIDRIAADRFLASMARRLRKSIAVGRICVSPSDIAGNSRGRPPASQTPRFTYSAMSEGRYCKG